MLVWTDAEGHVAVTTLAEDADPARVIEILKTDRRMPEDAVILVDPPLPADWKRQYAWVIRDGVVIDDPTVPAPRTFADEVRDATSVDDLKALLLRLA